ncbi:MAG: hypothetical protein JST10_09735, partial [Bacteroidetes bacterium]|nr:hypothetical protein [Bacteroidota bacterium]
NLRNCAYLNDFYEPKIIYPNMTKFMPFVYDKHQFFTNDKSFIMTGENLEYLTAFLNSSLFKFAFKDYFPELLGETRELRKVFFETIPIKYPDDVEWYKKTLAHIEKNKTLGLPINAYLKEIDEKIFSLYELTGDERLLITLTLGSDLFSVELSKEISSSVRV